MVSKFLLTIASVLTAQLCVDASKVRFDPNIGSFQEKEMFRTIDLEDKNFSSNPGKSTADIRNIDWEDLAKKA
jgi:hypothetical protein